MAEVTQPVREFTHEERVRTVVVFPIDDASCIVTGSEDNMLRQWFGE